MEQFKELSKEKVSKVEKGILKTWKQEDILNLTIQNRKDNENFVFYDGPVYANGMPGVHHMLAKFLKDAICKYQTMQGKKVKRRIGWDTHGLPIEVQAEKELGFKEKKDIEKYGIKEFNEKCREVVMRNQNAFSALTDDMGQFIDMDNPYVTCDNNFIETEWWILKKFYDEGYFYRGQNITPYCYRCGTGLASHEVAQGYKEVKVDTVTVPMKLVNEDNTYFLVWTTTPWTLIANVAVCVNPDEEYVKVLSKGNNFIVAKALKNKVLGDEGEIVETYKGKDLEYTKYEQLIPSLKVDKDAFFVTCDTYVSMEDGTGIVHMAPAFGEDDNRVGKKYNLPSLNPVGDDGRYKEGLWTGMNVFDADVEVIKYLKENDKIFKKQAVLHNYPHCWRCKEPLLYYSTPGYYLEVTKLKEKLIENNNKINWYPSYVGEKRFGNWLENLNDWAISRERYWGTPIPLWKCECGHEEMLGSISELKEKSIFPITDEIDLHRPFVDDIHIKCDKCGKTMTRIPEVVDVWFDSGSVPFAQNHYPFETKEFEDQFPADFIAEGIDQTRGWFYSLLVISTFLTGKSPYKNVLVNDLLLDKDGKKMHKSRGNAIDPFPLMEEYGADNIRFYMAYVSPVWTPLKFNVEGLKEVHSKFFNTLKNTYSFFAMYANTDNIDPRNYNLKYEDLALIDKWLLSKYNRLVKTVTEAYDEYDLTKVVRSLTTFVNEDLSNWYIRRNRRRFWESELTTDKKAVYKTTYDILVGLCQILAPISPYISEEIYKNLTGEKSVHLSDFPLYNKTMINKTDEEKMDLVRELISLGRNGREESKIKVRQPISKIMIDGKDKEVIGELTELIEEELNVKEVVYINDLTEYMSFFVKPNFKIAGPIFGQNIKKYSEVLSKLPVEDIISLQNGLDITIVVDETEYNINSDMVDIRVQAKEGFTSQLWEDKFVILDTELTTSLIHEGLSREFVSKVQNLRKESGFEIVDRIKLYYYGDEEFITVINEYEDSIKEETLALELIKDDNITESFNLNGHEVYIDVKRV